MMHRFAKYLAAFGAMLSLGVGGAAVAAASGHHHHHSHRSMAAMKAADVRNDLLPGEQGEVQNGQTETQSGEQGEIQNGEAEANQSGEQGEIVNGEQAEANQSGEQGESAPVGSGDHQS